ncbi:Beta-galactosidase [Halotydeus destructor]|nr:Beta-galactosidase [Halotydeus destructor]
MQVADELLSIKCLIVVDSDANGGQRKTNGGKSIYSHTQLLNMADGGELLSQPLTTEGDPESTPASIHFSSGSTGPRKGVVRSHSNFIFLLASQARGPSFTMSLHLPIAHTSGGTSTLRGAIGVTLVISEAFGLSTFLEAVQKHKIQMAILAPSALSEMVKNSDTCAKYNLSSLVQVFVGGAPLPDALKSPGAQVSSTHRSFVIDYEKNCFLKDGVPFRYASGSMDYFRIPRELWRDRLTNLRLSGLNAVQTYIEWSTHEPEPDRYTGLDDIVNYIKMSQDIGLLVILQPGPHISAERDFGGFPYWIMVNSSMPTGETLLGYYDDYISHISKVIRPLLYSNGGPVIMVQVNNKYGTVGCNHDYMASLRDMYKKHLADHVILTTMDSYLDNALECGKTEGVYATVAFCSGEDVRAAFSAQRSVQPGPLVNSEFCIGLPDKWGTRPQSASKEAFLANLKEILDLGASVNIYPFHGGTNFGFTSGASWDDDDYVPFTTSHDFNGVLDESGDTRTYFALRNLLALYLPLPEGTQPRPTQKLAADRVQMYPAASLSNIMAEAKQLTRQYPMTFEQLGVSSGYVVYRTTISFKPSGPTKLSIPGLQDRAQVILDGNLVGILSRQQQMHTMPLVASKGSDLVIVVENQGRISYGKKIAKEIKGIIGNVTFGFTNLTDWTHYYHLKLEAENHTNLINPIRPFNFNKAKPPAMFTGPFTVPLRAKGYDTFLRLDGWGKGVAFINGINIGRYWPDQGPQVTLYVPHPFLRPGATNYVSLFETDRAPCSEYSTCVISFTTAYELNGTTPYSERHILAPFRIY